MRLTLSFLQSVVSSALKHRDNVRVSLLGTIFSHMFNSTPTTQFLVTTGWHNVAKSGVSPVPTFYMLVSVLRKSMYLVRHLSV